MVERFIDIEEVRGSIPLRSTMTRVEAYQILKENVKSENLIRHHLACEAVMRALYLKLNTNQNTQGLEEWGIVGLLHDADYELSKEIPEKHTLILEQKIGTQLPSELMYAIKSHNFKNNKVEPQSMLDWSIYCCDELTGLIVAAALVSPEKKLKALTAESILKRFKEKSFAKGADRKQIEMCTEKLKIPLNEFIQIALTSMQQIAPYLGL